MRVPAWMRLRRTAFSLMRRHQCSTLVMRGTPSTSAARYVGPPAASSADWRASSSFRVGLAVEVVAAEDLGR
jgi:hypothetical protein